MNGELFDFDPGPAREDIAPGAVLLRGLALDTERELLAALDAIAAQAPFRHMETPGGHAMSVATTNCGDAGWISDRRGYRYARQDPQSGEPWPALPPAFLRLAGQAAAQAGYADFVPDACLVNRYAPGARMSLHQDRDERDFSQPIVSVSLGLPAVFQFGAMQRSGPASRHLLRHGDIVVWGGPARLRYHGVLALQEGNHPALGRARVNLTLRKAF